MIVGDIGLPALLSDSEELLMPTSTDLSGSTILDPKGNLAFIS